MKRIFDKTIVTTLALCLFCIVVMAQRHVAVTVNPGEVENRVSDKLYGFLLEHIYHSVSNGVWGEDVWNRSFEETRTNGEWTVDNDGTVTLNAVDDTDATFQIGKGKDFELQLDVQTKEGNGDIKIWVRDQSRDGMPTNSILWTLGKSLTMRTGWIWYHPTASLTTDTLRRPELKKAEWVHVTIKCNGKEVAGYENGQMAFNKSIADCPDDGFITLGGSNIKAVFKNITLRSYSSDGNYIDLSPIRHWKLVGNGTISATGDNPLNDHTAALLTSKGKFAGIQQPGKYVVIKGDPLVGSVWLRGSVSTATVCLTDDGKVIASQRLNGIGKEWKCFKINLGQYFNTTQQKDTLSNNATLCIYTGRQGVLYIDQVSLMHQSSVGNGGFRPSLTNAVADAHPAVLRWPGGSFSEQYHFENGIGPQEKRKGKLGWDDYDPLSFGTDDFIAFCRKVGAEPQIVVPIGYHNYRGYDPGNIDWLQRAIDWMDYCNGDSTTFRGKQRISNGHAAPYNVKYWEIDNEVWKMDAHQYAAIVKKFSTVMREHYPDIKIIACGCGRLGKEGVGLDSIIINDVAEYADYISPHYYQTIDKFGNDGVEEYGRYFDKLASWIAKSKNPDMKIYASEWNLDGVDMRTGLFAGGFLNRLERTPKVEMAAVALLLRHTSAPGWNNAFINFDKEGWYGAPNYVVFKLWRDHYLPLRVALDGDTDCLNISATASEDKSVTCLKIVNPTAESVMLDVADSLPFKEVSMEIVTAESLSSKNTMSEPQNVKPVRQTVKKEDNHVNVQVEPYSASVITIR